MPLIHRTYLYLSLVVFCATLSHAQKTINVPADQATIQGAINAANNGDNVLVAPGTYYENINFNGKAITVTSSAGAAQTTIDGSSLDSVVFFDTGEGLGSVLNGFTIQNGAPHGNGRGSGVYISSASPTITNNVIQNNTACWGAGIYSNAGGPKIQSNVIQNNVQPTVCSGAYAGAGIYLGGANFAQITGNVILNNLEPVGDGGGIGMNGPNGVNISNNIIANNQAGYLLPDPQGGGIYIINLVSAFITQNVIYGNTSGTSSIPGLGGGIYAALPSGSSGLTVTNNTIVGDGPGKAALYTAYYGGGQSTFTNNLVIGYSGQDAMYCAGGAPGAMKNNNAYTPNGVGFDASCGVQAGQNGNTSVDPLFVNSAASNFHLQASSPAIDAGTNSAPSLPQTDFAGTPRILDGNNDCISTIDMGAYELQRAANVSLSKSSLSFGNQVVGTSSSALPIALSNTGNTCFQFSSIGTTGDFSQASNCPAAGVLGGTSCTLSVVFSPTASGPRLGALGVSGTDGVTPSNLNVNLSGTGIAPQPAISLFPTSLSFGGQAIGTTSFSQTITVTSTGNTGLAISSISVSGPFLQSNNCPASVAPTLTCSISVSFRPGMDGAQAGTLSISDNASGSPQMAGLSGIGLDFSVGVSPASASVKHGQSASTRVNVNPTRGAFNSAVSLSCAGLPNGAGCGFSPASVTPGSNVATSVLILSTSGKTPRGNFNVVITGTSGSDSHSATLALTVN